MTGIDVALDALRADAKVWRQAADELAAPVAVIAELRLADDDMSTWAVSRGFDQTYERARSTIESMLNQAMATFHGIDGALRAAAETYQREDAANADTMNRLMR